MGQRYAIVAAGNKGGEPLDAEVRIRAYMDAKCKCCGARVDASDYTARLEAAYNDGLALGQMLCQHSVGEYMRGLRDGLRCV